MASYLNFSCKAPDPLWISTRTCQRLVDMVMIISSCMPLRAGDQRRAGKRRRRRVRRDQRRSALRPGEQMGRQAARVAGSHQLLQQGDHPRHIPTRRHGPLHLRHRRLRQAPR